MLAFMMSAIVAAPAPSGPWPLCRPAAAAACPVPVYEGGCARALEISAPDCRDLLAVRREGERLRALAGLKPEQLELLDGAYGVADGRSAAYYEPETLSVRVNLALAHAPPEVQRATLAHEIGHALQDRDGLLGPIMALYDRDSAGFNRGKRRLEAHADAVGQQLLARAGEPEGAYRRAIERVFGCSQDSDEGPTGPYPTLRQRRVNTARAAERIAREPAGAPFKPAFALADFDDFGALRSYSGDGPEALLPACGSLR